MLLFFISSYLSSIFLNVLLKLMKDIDMKGEHLFMKHFIIPFCLIALLFAGCTTESTTDENNTSTSASTSASSNTEDAEWKETLQSSVQSVTSRVSETLSRVNNLETPTGSTEEQQEQYTSLKQEIADIEREIDHVEEVAEEGLRNSKLTQEEFKKLDRELESLEELLDSGEDRLEITFGLDD